MKSKDKIEFTTFAKNLLNIFLVLAIFGVGIWGYYEKKLLKDKVKEYQLKRIVNITKNDSIIKNALKSNAELQDLIYIFNDLAEQNNEEPKEDYTVRLTNYSLKSEEIYQEEVPFGEILKVVKSYYVQNTDNDTIVKKLKKLITEYNKSSPFDILEKNQKYFFENIKKKSQNYNEIEKDIQQIVKEMESKNKLVNKYLKNSEDSFSNSKIAMALASISLLLTLLTQVKNLLRKK